MTRKKKVLLIGWDAADWKFLNPLIDQGLMPNLQKLIEEGVMGRLATLDPPLSPTLWTSIATGKRPYKHGIYGFTEPTENNEAIRPMFNTNRKVKAIWNILTQHGLKTHVVGWWPSHPAEPINGTMISNLYQRAHNRIFQPWPMKSGTVHPAEKSDFYAALRVHPEELTAAHLKPFVPNIEKVDQSKDRNLLQIAQNLADCSTIHAASTYILENEEWDFMAVYHDAIDHFCHGYMQYHPPRRPHIPKKQYELYNYVVQAACRYHDMMLRRLLDFADEDTTVMLISDHGFHPDHNRPDAIPNTPTGPAIEHSDYGIIVMKGPGIKKDDTIFGASLLDITPTILSVYDLPVGEDMDGKVLVQAFEEAPEIESILSWENIKGKDGSHPKDLQVSEEDARAELKQLIELGYIEDPGENAEEAIKNTNNENNFNLARSYIDGGKWQEGIEVLEKLHEENPKVLRFAHHLASAYQFTGDLNGARKLVNHIRDIEDRDSATMDILEGTVLLGEQRFEEALSLFQKADKEGGHVANLDLRMAHAYLNLNRVPEAEQAIERELKNNPEEALAHYTKGLIEMQKKDFESALDALMDAVALDYYSANTHLKIGQCLVRLEQYEAAAEALETCLKLFPGSLEAREEIIQIYEQHLQQPQKAILFKKDLESLKENQNEIRKDETLPSGLEEDGLVDPHLMPFDPVEIKEAVPVESVEEEDLVQKYNQALSYIDGGKWKEGISLLEELHALKPEHVDYAYSLFQGYHNTGKFKAARKVLLQMREKQDGKNARIDILEGILLMTEKRFPKALEFFERARNDKNLEKGLNLLIARACMHMGRYDEADKAIHKELEKNRESAAVWHTKGMVHFHRLEYEKALQALRHSLGLNYRSPYTQLYVGETLMGMQRYEEAIEVFDKCIELFPNANRARERIIKIYCIHLDQPGKAVPYLEAFNQKIKGTITIVSGLPRSGTSMMMQMLKAGGMEIFTDEERAADENNPKGYYEHDAVKSLKGNHQFLEEASGKVMKVIAQLLRDLPMNFRYQVIFMERDIMEVIASQQKMLQRIGKQVDTETLPLNLVQQYERTIEEVKKWAKKHPTAEVLFVPHRRVIEAPFVQAIQVNDFLGTNMEVEKMAAAVDNRLYRERSKSKSEVA